MSTAETVALVVGGVLLLKLMRPPVVSPTPTVAATPQAVPNWGAAPPQDTTAQYIQAGGQALGSLFSGIGSMINASNQGSGYDDSYGYGY